ncbi:hypothetical protein HHK36_020197 [Tetracentron sinense]|uniref:Uncharacterized protein n=1 Tax=Tetracentron sinense TaxID=13715 RepID=A0A834YTM8_TETSI|nr:hypothetical protein HHK36_020197 [Tetracentron sinense]
MMKVSSDVENLICGLKLSSVGPGAVTGADVVHEPTNMDFGHEASLPQRSFTWFKCGGMSVGLNWAHVLGDAFSASNFINMWGQIMADNEPLNLPKSQIKTGNSKNQSLLTEDPLSMKRVDHVGDYWIAANNSKTETFSFKITATQLEELQSKILDQSQTIQISSFESILAVIWQCLAKIRHGSEPRIRTVCRNDSHSRRNGKLSNNQIISVVKADFSVVESDPKELAALVVEQTMNEKSQIEEEVEKGQGLSDFIMYGSNLTFVNLQEADLYGLELKGQKPVFVNYMIDGVGNEGVILVLPWPKDVGEACCQGRTVTVILPKNEVLVLRAELKREWSIA